MVDDARRQATREIARRELARRLYYDYARYVFRGWQDTIHHHILAEYLQGVEQFVATNGAKGIGRLMVFMPPRHGKSLNVSVLFPTWFLGRNPDKRVIIASYNGNLAMDFSRQGRNLMMDTRYRAVFGDKSGQTDQVRIADDSRSVEAWNVAGHHGGLVAAGVGGGITGRGAHLLVIDDPVRDRADAESRVRRKTIWKWYTSTAYTRLEKGAAIVVMHTRWHEDDLAGRLLKRMITEEGADRWTVLCLPAIAEEWAEHVEADEVIKACQNGWWRAVDPLGRTPGEPLWPEKYDLATLRSNQANIGGYEWDALYQQRPRQLEGAMIKAHKIRIVGEVPAYLRVVRYWDLAVSGRERADFIVGGKVGRDPQRGRVYILDIARFRGPWADARPRMVQVMLADGVTVEQGIEVAGQQGGYFQELQRDKKLQGLTIRSVNPRDVGGKEVRANVWASRIEDDLIYMLRAPWNNTFVSEALAFPRGSHDDQVDGVSGAVQMLGALGGPAVGETVDVPVADYRREHRSVLWPERI